jgi:hypothetical protein
MFSSTAKHGFGRQFSTVFARRILDIQLNGIVSRDEYFVKAHNKKCIFSVYALKDTFFLFLS